MFKKAVTYTLIFVTMLYGYRYALHEGIRKNEKGIFNKLNEAFLNKTTYDIVFLGSSRAEMHYSPKVFDSITHLSSFNLGISGASPNVSFSVLKAFCHNHPLPKYIVLNLDYYALKHDSDVIYNFPRFFPYLTNSYLRTELNNIDNRFNSFYYNPIHSLPYEQLSYLSTSIHGWFGIEGRYDSLCFKGYQTAETKATFQKTENNKNSYAYIHLKNRQYIDSICGYAKKNGIKLIIATSPIFHGSDKTINRTSVISQIKNIAAMKHVDYWDYSADSNYLKNPALFIDEYHLNRIGSELFTKQFSMDFNNKYGNHSF